MPWELQEIALEDLAEMLQGVLTWQEQQLDMDMQLISWQTALLMNASGNYKKAVKPEKLYEPLNKRRQKERASKESTHVDIEKKREELKTLFGLQEEGSSRG